MMTVLMFLLWVLAVGVAILIIGAAVALGVMFTQLAKQAADETASKR